MRNRRGSPIIARSENDTRELRTFARFLTELAAHKELEKTLGRSLPLDTATVPRTWWDPRGELPEPPAVPHNNPPS